jgi:uncharacterized protein
MAGNTSNRGLGSDNMDEQTKKDIQSEGGRASHGGGRQSQGQKGGQSQASNLSEEDRSKGGSMSGGNFANDPQRASEAGKKGGSQ